MNVGKANELLLVLQTHTAGQVYGHRSMRTKSLQLTLIDTKHDLNDTEEDLDTKLNAWHCVAVS